MKCIYIKISANWILETRIEVGWFNPKFERIPFHTHISCLLLSFGNDDNTTCFKFILVHFILLLIWSCLFFVFQRKPESKSETALISGNAKITFCKYNWINLTRIFFASLDKESIPFSVFRSSRRSLN